MSLGWLGAGVIIVRSFARIRDGKRGPTRAGPRFDSGELQAFRHRVQERQPPRFSG